MNISIQVLHKSLSDVLIFAQKLSVGIFMCLYLYIYHVCTETKNGNGNWVGRQMSFVICKIVLFVLYLFIITN